MARRYVPQGAPAVVYGEAALDDLGPVLDSCGATRVMVVTTRSLAADGALLGSVIDRLGPRWVVTFATCRQHTPGGSVREGAAMFSATGADGLVSLGGGSAVDTAKGIAITAAVGPDLTEYHAAVTRSLDGMVMRRGVRHDALTSIMAPGPGATSGRAGPNWLAPHVAVPTTLSGAEFTDHAGITDAASGVKHQVYHPSLVPAAVILDPRATASTPRELWLSTGIKVLDHVVEIIYSPHTSPASQAMCLAGMRRLLTHLGPSADPTDLTARHEVQLAAWLAVAGYPNQMAGVSHAIDHQLGALCDVPHGIGACCLLPHAMRFNLPAAGQAFALMAAELGRRTGAGETHVGTDGPDPENVPDVVAEVIARLGLPSRLRDVGVARQMLPRLAAQSLADPTLAGNPRPVDTAQEILEEILEPAW